MDNLSPEEKKRLENAVSFLEKGGDLSEMMPLVSVLEEIRDSLKVLAEKETPELPTPPEEMRVTLPGVELVTIKGEPGKDPTDEHLLELIKPNIPPPIKGDSYVLTPKDKKEIAQSITVPIVEKEIETIIEKQPIITNEIKEVAVTDTAEQIMDKINADESDKQIKQEKVEGLDDRFKGVDRQISSIPRGGSRASHGMKLKDLSSQANGSLKVFSVPKSVTAIVFMSDAPNVLMENNGFTLNATRTQLTLTVQNAPTTGSQLIFQYAETFNT